jgi:protein-S-isoprenylcysteine O-methyltransferase Ste14
MKIVQNSKKSLSVSVWIIYLLIVFEILYMISPFALYYYSLYKIPLNFLKSNPYTEFLIVNILPHFSYHTSYLISILNFISWPLIIIGSILFLINFSQIYWNKFTRKGIVCGGMYKVIRHPQYLSLAILGLGTTIYWPRFLVYLMYCSMLFLYYFLARQEERICLAKFGESYKRYLENTGMFFPIRIEKLFRKIPRFLPKKKMNLVISIVFLYLIFIIIMASIGFMIKNYSSSKILARSFDGNVVISVAPLVDDKIEKIIDILKNDDNIKQKLQILNNEKYLSYIVPSEWNIPELGLIGSNGEENFLSHSSTHGNSIDFNQDYFIVLITKPILSLNDRIGDNILKTSISFIPCFEILIYLPQKEVKSILDRKDRGKWDGIPVPIY